MLNALRALSSTRVAVVGDVMLDIYIGGEVERISPEAPVPVVRLVSESVVPGGAANVAANLASLGAAVRLVGLVGEDDGFARLAKTLAGYPTIDTEGLVRTRLRSTTTKTRVVGHRQQIARIDREDTRPLERDIEALLIRQAEAAAAECGAVIVSDYGKGLLTDAVLHGVLAAARRAGVAAIVDPKRRDLSGYRGATIITPNRSELALATGLPCNTDEEIVAAARAATAACGADILVTRSEKGMSFVPANGEPIHLATVAREVFDVSGAGDTVVAVLGGSLAAGLPMVEAMRAANHAAGIVVAKLGTAVITLRELEAAMHEVAADADCTDGRLFGLDDLVAQRARWRSQGLTVGLANGCFDLLHPGHVSLIGQAAGACDRLIMALNTDASVRRLKGASRPVQSDEARAAVMGAMKGVAAVVLFDEDTPLALISSLQPDVLVKGADYRIEDVVGADIVRSAGGSVVLAQLAEGQSTSGLIARMHRQEGSEGR